MNNARTLLFLGLLSLFLPLHAQEVLVNKVFDRKSKSEIKITLLTSSVPPAGYTAVQAEVTTTPNSRALST